MARAITYAITAGAADAACFGALSAVQKPGSATKTAADNTIT